jgi:hypothetical protein
MYLIEYADSVADDLADLRAYDRRQILDHIDPAHKTTEEIL